MGTRNTATTKDRILTLVERRPVNGMRRQDLFRRLADENPESVARRVRELLADGYLTEKVRGSDVVLVAL